MFRSLLVGSTGHSGLTIVASGLLFGVLHISGGRNYASGVFSSAAGCLYGWLYVSQASLPCACIAHAVGNITSAAAWLLNRSSGKKGTHELQDGSVYEDNAE
jgi:uncharacterized protein